MDNQQLTTLTGISSTTIPRKGSTQEIVEKEWVLLSNWRVAPSVSGIYIIRNAINEKNYIGISGNLRKRFKEHFYLSKNIKIKGSSKIKNAIKKYGIDNFYFLILEETNLYLKEKEKIYIEKYNSVKNGYNIKYYDEFYKEYYKKSKYQIERELQLIYEKEIITKSTLCFDLNGNFLNSFKSRVLASKYYNYNKRTLNESVTNNSNVILNNKESFYKCGNHIFIDKCIYDNRKIVYLKHNERNAVKNNIPLSAIEKSKKKISFIDNNYKIYNFDSIVSALKTLKIAHSTYHKHKLNTNYIYNNKYKLNIIKI